MHDCNAGAILLHNAYLKEKDKILILGASGGTGSAAVQLGKSVGAVVYLCIIAKVSLQSHTYE